MWIGYSRGKYQTCLTFKPITTDPNRLKQTVWNSKFLETDSLNTLIGSLSHVVEQGHKKHPPVIVSWFKVKYRSLWRVMARSGLNVW